MLFRYFYNRPLLLAMILLIVSLLGVIGYLKMPRNMFPDVERPQVTVITQLPGASALTVAQKLSRPLEQELYALSLVRDVQSTNKNEVSIVRAEFDYEKGQDAALLDVNNALSRVRAKLPAEAPPSSVYAVGGFTQPVMVLAVAPKEGSGLDLAQVRMLAENDIRTSLITAPSVANVEVFGGYEPAVRIEFDPLKLAQYRIGQAQLQELIGKFNRDWPLGTLQGGGSALTMTVYGERAEVDKLRLLPLAKGLTLGDVAQLKLSHAERYSAYHGNGKPAIAVSVLRAPGGAVQAAIDDVEAQLPLLRARYPNLEFAVSDTQGELIRNSNSNMMHALQEAIAFTCLIILFFLGNWRAVVTALISIPLVFLSTVAILWLLGKEMNILVMTGIILALGMLVDDAVVVLENIERHLEVLHEDMQTAVQHGTEEVLFPVFVGTLATAVVISPLMFVGDFSQQIFKHLILAVVIAVFTSYFIAVTFIPRLSAFWYRNGFPPKNRLELWMERLYQRGVEPGAKIYTGMLQFAFRGGFRRRLLLVLPAFALLVFSFKTVMPMIGNDALPPMDTGIVRVHVKFGANEPVSAAEERLKEFEARLMQDKRVLRVSTAFGSEAGVISMGSGQLPAEATYTIHYVSRLERGESSWQIEADLRRQLAALPGVTIADAFDSGATALSTVKAPVDIRLYAEDWRLLPAAADKVKAAMGQVQGLTSVSASWDADTQEAHLVLDEDKLRALGAHARRGGRTPAAERRAGRQPEQATDSRRGAGAHLFRRTLPLQPGCPGVAADSPTGRRRGEPRRNQPHRTPARRLAAHHQRLALQPGYLGLPQHRADQHDQRRLAEGDATSAVPRPWNSPTRATARKAPIPASACSPAWGWACCCCSGCWCRPTAAFRWRCCPSSSCRSQPSARCGGCWPSTRRWRCRPSSASSCCFPSSSRIPS